MYGRGTRPRERAHALEYAKAISSGDVTTTEFVEGQEDPMFTMAIGEEERAQADFWKYRIDLDKAPTLFRVDLQEKAPVSISQCYMRSENG
jgi:hypothetical protein